jgi:hypothetical protein
LLKQNPKTSKKSRAPCFQRLPLVEEKEQTTQFGSWLLTRTRAHKASSDVAKQKKNKKKPHVQNKGLQKEKTKRTNNGFFDFMGGDSRSWLLT